VDTLASGCAAISDVFAYARTAANVDKSTDIGLTVFPVPASTNLYVVFKANAAADLDLSLVNSVGQTIVSEKQSIPQGNFSTVINVTGVQPGVYILRAMLGNKVYAKKVIVVH
jgi:hypothetical protein